MSVGIIDHDCIANKKDFFYDLDVMKLAAYYKGRREITRLLLDLKEHKNYSQIYFIKNRFDYKFSNKIFNAKNTQYRGYAFSAETYEPLPDDIERTAPDISIYDTYLKYNDNIAERRLAQFNLPIFENSCHARLSTNSTNCNIPTEQILYKESEGLCLYDYNIFAYPDWREATEDMRDKSLRMRFPPITTNLDDITFMLENYQLRRENHLILSSDNNMESVDELVQTCGQYKDKIKVQIFKDLNPYDKDEFHAQIISAISTILTLKASKTRIHTYVDSHDIDERTVFLNNISYWCNRNHSDISLGEFIERVRKRGERQFSQLISENDIIKTLYYTKPSEWRR